MYPLKLKEMKRKSSPIDRAGYYLCQKTSFGNFTKGKVYIAFEVHDDKGCHYRILDNDLCAHRTTALSKSMRFHYLEGCSPESQGF